MFPDLAIPLDHPLRPDVTRGCGTRREVLIIAKMRPHQRFPQFAVVRHGEMEQLMDDDVIAKLRVHAEQLIVEAQRARSRAGGPLAAHRADVDGVRFHVELRGPFEHAGFELLPVAPWHGGSRGGRQHP